METKITSSKDALHAITEFLEKQDLLTKLTEVEKLHGYGYSDVHVISAIDSIDHANVTKIADYMHMTRGAISKVTKRLKASGCITSYAEESNQKEVYFKLTNKGEFIHKEHSKRHQLWEERDMKFLENCSYEELQFITNFMKNYNHYLEVQIRKLGEK